MHKHQVLLICQFGRPVRGISPYGDALFEALKAEAGIDIQPIDYRSAYPGWLHPAVSSKSKITNGELHWANPISWWRIAKIKADILHIQHWGAFFATYLLPLAVMAKRAGKCIVITVHNPEPHEEIHWAYYIEKRLLSVADALIVHNSRGATTIQKRFSISGDRIHIIPHGIYTRSTPSLPQLDDYARLGLDPAKRYVCIFGNLRGYKGVDVLVNAWAQVVTLVPNVDLIIAGRLWAGQQGLGARFTAQLLRTNQDADRLRAALAAPALNNRVHLYEGFQPEANIDALIKLSELAVFPYIYFASQSGAACRAAGRGCPVLVSNVGGLSDLAINTQWVVEPSDVKGLVSALYKMLTLCPKQLRLNREIQLERVQHFSWAHVAAAHAALYRELTSS